MITGKKFSVREDALRYQARTVLAELADKIAASRSLNKSVEDVLRATKIRLWLKALDYKAYLTREQREKIWYCLIQLSGVNDFPIAPVLEERTRPSVLQGASPEVTINQYYDTGFAFNNSANVSPGVETVDSFAFSLGTGCRWDYTVTNGTDQRSGSVLGTWLSDGSDWESQELSTAEIGDTSDVTMDVVISAGSAVLQATEASTGWIVSGKRYIIA